MRRSTPHKKWFRRWKRHNRGRSALSMVIRVFAKRPVPSDSPVLTAGWELPTGAIE